MDGNKLQVDYYPPWIVYNNLIKMMVRRGVTIKDEGSISADLFVRNLNQDGIVAITGNRGDDDIRGAADVICILIATNNKYSTGDFRKMLNRYIGKRDTGKNTTLLNIILVSEEPLSIHVKKQIENVKSEFNVHIEDYTYKIFMINLPEHTSVPEHRIATNKEVEEFCTRHCTLKDRLPKITTSDPQAVWLGLRPGMVTKIIRPSETAGFAIAYRVCIK